MEYAVRTGYLPGESEKKKPGTSHTTREPGTHFRRKKERSTDPRNTREKKSFIEKLLFWK